MILSEAMEPGPLKLYAHDDRCLCNLNGLCRWPSDKGDNDEQKLLLSDQKTGPFPSDP